MKTQQTWLITGVAGFIGSNVAEHLLSLGHIVIGLDNLSSGDIRNLDSFHALENWHWFPGDINDEILPILFDRFQITHVLHLAAIVSVQACEQNPQAARYVNEQGFERVLNLALSHHVTQFIYASSSAVYGSTTHLPIVETTPLHPISLYGKTKVSNELAAQNACNDQSISCIGFRFFNLFGPHQGVHSGYAAVIPKWVDAIKHHQTPIIYGDGSATRDFCPIDNVLLAIDRAVLTQHLGHHVFNIGNGYATSLQLLYDKICDILGEHPQPQYLPWRSDDIVHSCADITLAQTVLGYQPEVTLQVGLEKLL